MPPITETPSLKARVRQIVLGNLQRHAKTASVGDGDSLYEAGMDSHASVNLMLALEAGLDIEFPNRLLTRSVFTSIDSITDAVAQLRAG